MSLHETIEVAKKVLIWIFVAVGGIFLIFILFQFGVIVKNILFPPEIQQPTVTYGQLQAIRFPENAVTQQFTYNLNTVSGVLPAFPNRLNVFPIALPKPNFLNLNKAKEKAAHLDFVTINGTALPEISLGNNQYQWRNEEKMNRKLTMNIVTFDFLLESDYLNSVTVSEAKNITNTNKAVDEVKQFLGDAGLFSTDIDIEKTLTPVTDIAYVTNPQLYAIQNSALIPTTSLSTTKVIRVDLYQQDVEYTLQTGIPDLSGGFKEEKVTLPIIYPRPPYSTMSFWIASSENGVEVMAAKFTHQGYSIPTDVNATYAIKTADEAFEELKNGKGYIATFDGTGNNVQVTKVYLAYYLGEFPQIYLMPVIVFEGSNGFFAYVSAVSNDWITE